MNWNPEQLEAWRQEAYKNARNRSLSHEDAQDAAQDAIFEILQIDSSKIDKPEHYASSLIRNVICDAATYIEKRAHINLPYSGTHFDLIEDDPDSPTTLESHEESSIDYLTALDAYDDLTERQKDVVREVAKNLSSPIRYHHRDIAETLDLYPDRVRHILSDIRRHANRNGDDED